jgi:hypothetical protein
MSKTEKVRKGPSESATKFSVGFVKKGNDGNMWKIVATAAGVHRWSKIQGVSGASGARTPNHNKTVKNNKNIDKNTDNVSLEDLKKLAKKHKVLSAGKSKGELALLIFNIRGTGLSTEELKKIVDLLSGKDKRKAKEMIANQSGNSITDYRGLWRPAPKPINKMSRNEIINNLRKFRDAWEHEQGRNQGLSDEIMAGESETNLRERLSWYFSETAKNQAANWIRDNQEGEEGGGGDNTHSAKTPFKMTEYAASVYNGFKNRDKIKIVKVVKGQAALDGIRKAFFGDDKVEADKWQKKTKWSSRDIAESIFFVYERKLRKNTEKVCKFVIGRKGDGSVLGQVI